MLLSYGNSAKLYCLNWIDNYVKDKKEITILDLGSGISLNFVSLLKKYSSIHYTGVEPSPKAVKVAKNRLEGLNATIINDNGYNLFQKLAAKFDIITSFSALEHVYRRRDYLNSAKECLKPHGYFLINYDAGHFISGKERLINIFGPILARFGIERFYQSFVRENEFFGIIKDIGLKITDAKFFNSNLKGIYKIIPTAHQDEFMKRWLEFEIFLNQSGIAYDDSLARYFYTRNFVLTH